MISCLRNSASCPTTVFAAIMAASAGALFAALYSQLALGLQPCELCLYQRIPFFAAIILAALGLGLRSKPNMAKFFLALCALAFLINSGIAAYHSGIERHWWTRIKGCEVPDFSKDPSLIEKILTMPAAQCDVIAWADPFFGLTMANYNVLFCLGLALGCVYALRAMRRPGPSEVP